MRIDLSFLPALAAAFMLVFARVGAMVMLMPSLGETNIPMRIKLAIALLLALIILPLHRSAYQVDMTSLTPLLVLMLQEIFVGIVLGATARVTLSALQVAGSVIAQQLGLGFVTSVDPTQGQQGVLIGNFLTMLGVTLLFATDAHHLVIQALSDSYKVFAPGELLQSGDVAALATRARRDGDVYVLDGQKQFISGAGNDSDFYLVMARTGEAGPRGGPQDRLLDRFMAEHRHLVTRERRPLAPARGDVHAKGGERGVYRSTDGGSTWSAATSGARPSWPIACASSNDPTTTSTALRGE